MMFAAVPPSWMIPWTRASGRQLLAPQADRAEQQDHRVERVLALPRVRRRRGPGGPWKTTSTSSDASGWLSTWLRSQGWNSRAASMPSNSPSSIMICLAAAPFLGRRAEEHDLAGELVGDRRQRDRRADARRGHRVVAAAVAESRQGVVLGEDPDPRAAPTASAAERRADRGREAARPDARPRTRGARARRRPRSRPAAPRTRARGSAWIRWDSSTISSRRASTAAASRAFISTYGGAGWWTVRVTEPPGCSGHAQPAAYARRDGCGRVASAFRGQRRLGDDDERQHEEHDREREDALEPEQHEDRRRTSPTQPPRRTARVQSPL